jgi:hypothetical protein
MCELSATRRSAVNRPPAFEWFVSSGFPISEFGINHDARLKVENERGLILKADFNNEISGGDIQFHSLNDLAFGLGELEHAPLQRVFGTLTVSHSRLSSEGDLVRAANVRKHGRGPLTL